VYAGRARVSSSATGANALLAWQVPHVTNSTPAADEFAIGPEGSIWLAENARKLRWWYSLPPSSGRPLGRTYLVRQYEVQMGYCPM
jgi:hypothetical protein